MIVIKDMEMPKNCADCNMATCNGSVESWNYVCSINLKDIDFNESERAEHCPLVEIIKTLNYDRNQYKAGYKDALEWMQRVIMLNMPDIIRYSENQDAGVQIKNINDYIDLRLKQLFESEDKK